ncbi:DUF6011 domain-containing protein [Streptomyces sp. NPDC046631]|uniref:DUF6011 domain-containing protein n=1 Tax=unclassified Streptomyces TaxID=2593676 RepID=UPI0033C0F862
MDRPPRNQQQLLIDDQATGYRHRYCRKCGRPLKAQGPRLRGYGDHCDPTRHPTPAPARDIDQDQLPGL